MGGPCPKRKRSAAEAERLLAGDEDAFEYFFESLQAVRTLRAHRNQLRDHNEQLARAATLLGTPRSLQRGRPWLTLVHFLQAGDNLGKEKELRELANQVTLLQNTLAEKRHVLEDLLRRQEELSHQYSTGLPARLKEAATQAEVTTLPPPLAHVGIIGDMLRGG